MNTKLNLKFGLGAIATVMVFLLISSPVAAVPSPGPNFGTNSYSTSPNIEYANIVAGLGQSTYATIFNFGGVDGSSYPVDTDRSGLANANSWFFASIDQSDFASYLQRAPSPVFAPDGLSLHLQYDGSSNTFTQTLNWATDAALEFESVYGLTFGLHAMNDGSAVDTFIFYANTTASVASEVATMGTIGLSQALNPTTINNAPVSWVGYGSRTLAGSQVAMFGAGWVNANGIQVVDSTPGDETYEISTDDIFGSAMAPTSVNPALSRVSITVPYPIRPTEINPRTTNPLPQVTGIAEWDLKHPIRDEYPYSIGGQNDLFIQYKLQTNQTFPNVQNKFSINQTKLTQDGILEGTFELTNSGDDVAEGVEVWFPLGYDADRVIGQAQKDIYRLDTANYYFDETFSTSFSMDVTMDVSGASDTVSEVVLDYSGWYRNVSGPDQDSLSKWDSSTQNIELFNDVVTISGVDTTVTVDVSNLDGFPVAVRDQLQNLNIQVSSTSDIESGLETEIRSALKNAFNDTLNTFYQKEQIFTPDWNNFTMTQDNYMVSRDSDRPFWWLNSTISEIQPGETETVTFRINNIPTTDDQFHFMDYNYTTQTSTISINTGLGTINYDVTFPVADVASSLQDYFEFMQYMFELAEWDGHPISFGTDATFDFGPSSSSFNLDAYPSSTYISHGAYVKYNNSEGFPFFSLSNGQNIQIADDEAVLTTTVDMDKNVYNPGENKMVNLTITNNGDAIATNVDAHLYHASLGRNWRFERIHKAVDTINVGTLNPGETYTTEITIPANSFVGFSPMFAIVEFDSEEFQTAPVIEDFLDIGINTFRAGAGAHHITYSTLDGALLLPPEGEVDLNPTLKEPSVNITKTVSGVNSDNEFTVTYNMHNDGEVDTTIEAFGQFYEIDEFSHVSSSAAPAGAAKITLPETGTDREYSGIIYGNIALPTGDTVTIEITFELLQDPSTLDPAFARFVIAGESTLGASPNLGSNDISGGGLLDLSAGSAAQEDSQSSANENSASSSYSSSSSVGASINTDYEGGDNTAVGFIGYDAIGFLSLMAIPITITVISRRKNLR